MKTRRVVPLTAFAAAALLLTACSSNVAEGTATTASPSASAVERTVVPSPPADPQPEVIWPLTGVDATEANEDLLARPALSIKIENSAAARPQQNLVNADVVFEEYVESGISRLVAVYHSDVPETLGPIRSMRPMDKNIMGSFEGPLIFSGAQGRFINQTASTGQEMIAQDTGGYGFYRTSNRAAPHNLYGTPEDFFAQTDATTPPQQFEYAYPAEESNVVTGGTTASAIDIHMSQYSNPSWDFDGEVWQRSEGGSPHVQDDGTQLYADNVIVLRVDVEYTGRSGGSSVPETMLAGRDGTGFAVVGDAYQEITWSKAGQFDPYVLKNTDGEVVQLIPGKTWVELVPQSGVSDNPTVNIS
ncbi:DUF3048 domain-containing protein [Demequina sp. B12]|uniref:DUF3048 domain-containing protein n=1 Tax=Demequina sp. B12 TaxID=2992757 RepID=UPI00237AE517|nr:DUF3048 domain-containing protein [Demequina sp. B12]MDE0572338.1 DUF3048 domain-containing protein [Demequina sp. B12]